MEEKYKSQNISYIYEQFLEILLMQIRSLYEEYDETYLDEFELKYRESYKDLINNSLMETDLEDKIKKLIMIEPDQYGLDRSENDTRIIISDIFRNIGIELSLETMIIKDKWKENQVGHLKNEILSLSEQVKSYKLEVDKLNNDIDQEKDKNVNLQLQLELLEEDNRKKSEHYEIEINNYKNKLDQSEKKSIQLIREKEVLKVKIKELEKYIKVIKNLEKEVEHLKSGIEMFKLKNTEKDKEIESLNTELREKEKKIKQLMDKNDEIDTENKALKNNILAKDKEIESLKTQLGEKEGETKPPVITMPVITMEEIKNQYNDIYIELSNQLKKINKEIKIIGGKNIRSMASNIHESAKKIKNIKEIIHFNDYLKDLLRELEEFNNLFEENNKSSDLIPSIDKLKNLKYRVEKGKVWR